MSTIALPGVGDDINDQATHLVDQLDRHAPTNRMLDAYYESARRLRRLHNGVVPEQYYRLGLVLGWASKAVDGLGRRCNLDRMVWPDGTLDEHGYREVWDGNRLSSEVDQGITDALIHGLGFVVASAGTEGEPPGLVHFYSAVDATGVRNPRTRRMDNLLTVHERAKDGAVSAFTLYLPGETYTAEVVDGRWQVTDHAAHSFGVPASPLVYRPRLRRPMGRTRLTRPIRALQDAAARELVRLEGHMDVYAYPEFWMLGADPSVFTEEDGTPTSELRQRMSRIKGIPDDQDLAADANNLARADVKQFSAASPEPHLAALNAYAKLFAREASLPDSAVAITDLSNPTSAESYDASQYELIAEAEGACADFSAALRHVIPVAMAMAGGLDEVPKEWASIDCQWRDPRYTSKSALADAGTKQVGAIPWLADTEVGMEMIGMNPQQIARALGERQRQQANARIDALVGLAQREVTSDGLPG